MRQESESSPKPNEQMLSLHYLRGIAALAVFYCHIVVLGIVNQGITGRYLPMLKDAPLPHSDSKYIGFYLGAEQYFNQNNLSIGYFAVALFFLISGFVIIRSVERQSLGAFFKERFFRIFPLCAFVATLVACIMALYARAYGFVSPYELVDVLASALLFVGLTERIQIMPVLWSLVVEVYFYLAIALAYQCFGRCISPMRLLGIAIIFFLFIAAVSYGIPHLSPKLYLLHILKHLSFNACFTIFILSGAALAKFRSSTQTKIKLGYILTSLLCVVLFSAASHVYQNMVPGGTGFSRRNALLAWPVFVALLFSERLMIRNRFLMFLGNISYPLYIIHVPLGWVILHELGKVVRAPLAIIGTLMSCILLAWLLHRCVEEPARLYGKRLAKPDLQPALL